MLNQNGVTDSGYKQRQTKLDETIDIVCSSLERIKVVLFINYFFIYK